MKAEQVREIADKALEQLAEALKAGKSEAMTQFLAAMARFHRYSFGNVMLIVSQRPDASHVAGFNTWKSLGRFVKKGEKGIVIMAPMAMKPTDAELAQSAAEGRTPERPLRFRGVYVFDITQTDGDPFPEPVRVLGDPGPALASLTRFAAERGIAVTHAVLPLGIEGLSKGGAIELHSGLEPAREFAVLAHELAHELLHHGDGATRGTKTMRETEAEAVAYVVTVAAGLDNGTASSDYIQLYSGTSETLADSMDRIQRTASLLIAAMSETDEQQRAA